ncbi:MAG TPA: selenocysteine-specific translation elongation factor [bacterium]|nr:selenocysteine-specific translation elongation factor [bacterium]HPR86912.1 selenocysteine-specific translation elongation factor [bacterium]
MPIIIGTAGHIDHGKSALVKALTGTDPDRLAEEHERGMTIDLGFAFLSPEIAFIDVPGHERFIKNMVAGVSTIDLALLVIAADDGVMPQTREHLDILSLLGVPRGLVVLTKIDLVDAELLDLVRDEVRETLHNTFLESAPLFEVSTLTGAGMPALREALIAAAGQMPGRRQRTTFWLPVDRSFVIKGFGTVVTGTLLSGAAAVGDPLELLPSGRLVKIRGLQQQGRSVEQVTSGYRTALNLQNIRRDEVQRGDVLATPGEFAASRRMDARLHLLKSGRKELTQHMRVRLHMGTRELMARVKILEAERLAPGGSALVQLLLEEPAVARRREPFVIRQYSPAFTIGGGSILDAAAAPHRRMDRNTLERLAALEHPDPFEAVAAALLADPFTPQSTAALAARCGLEADEAGHLLATGVANGELMATGTGGKTLYLHREGYAQLLDRIKATLEAFHQREPLRPGMSKAELRAQIGGNISPRLCDQALAALAAAGRIEEQPQWVRLAGHTIRLSAGDAALAERIHALLEAAPFAPPGEEEIARSLAAPAGEVRRLLGALQGMGHIVRLEGDLYFTVAALAEAERRLLDFAREREEISVGEFRELLATSRKYAVPLLNWFDQKGRTERIGDSRLVHR